MYSVDVIGNGCVTTFDRGVLVAGVDSDDPFVGDEDKCVVNKWNA